MYARNILHDKGSDIVTVTPDTTVADVARLFKSNRIGFALVRRAKADGFVGTVSERDIIHALADSAGAVAMRPIGDVLTANVVVCAPDDTAETMMETMTEKRTRHLLVMDGKDLLGVVSIGDLIKNQISRYRMEAEGLRDYVVGAGYH